MRKYTIFFIIALTLSSLVFSQSSRVRLATLEQGGATTNQTIKWSGTKWQPGSVAAGEVTGTFGISSGGTNSTATPTAGAVAYGTGSSYAFSSVGAANGVLISNGSAAPTWATNAPSAANIAAVNSANADANADRGVGLKLLVSSTGSSNFPSTATIGIEARRATASASGVGSWQLVGSNEDGLNTAYLRKLMSFTTVDNWGAWRQLFFTDSILSASQLPAHSGDVTSSAGSAVLTIAANAVTNAKLATMVNNTIKGNTSGSTAAPSDLTGTQVTAILDSFTSSLKGLVPPSGGGTVNYLRADGTWATPTAAAAPAGSDTQIQYNNAGVTGASANLTYSSTNNRLSIIGTNPTLELQEGADPSVPASGRTFLYAKNIAGETNVLHAGNVGANLPVQYAHAFSQFATVVPGGTTVLNALGTAFTNVGTVSHPTPASTNLGLAMRRAVFTSAATAGALNSHRQTTALVWRGNAAGLGGFRYVQRIKLDTQQAGQRGFFGLSSILTAPTNVDPTTLTAQDAVGLSFNTNTGNWQLQRNTTGTAPTLIDLGASFPLDTTSVIELVLFAAPNGSSIGYRVTNLSTAATSSGSLTTNLPTATTFLAPLLWNTNNATAAAVAFSLYKWTLESDN